MMRRATGLCFVVFALAVADPTAQNRPDFSGEWRPIDNAPAPPPVGGGPPPPPRTLALTIAHSPGELKVARRVMSDGREAVHNFTYKLDGTESVNQMGQFVFYTRGSWEGAALLLASDVAIEDQRIGTLRETYTLEEGKLTVDTIRTGPAGTMKTKTVHEKVVRAP